MAGIAYTSSVKPANFLTGEYSQGSNFHLPVHSTLFIATRVSLVVFVCALFLIFENFTLNQQIAKLSSSVTKAIAHPALGLSKVQINRYQKFPERLIAILKGKSKNVSQEVSTLQSALRIDATNDLHEIVSAIGTSVEGELLEFKMSEGLINATFKMNTPEDYEAITARLKRSDLKGLTVSLEGSNLIKIIYTDK